MDQRRRWWRESLDVLCEELHCDRGRGLSEGEAKRRLKERGPNRLPEAKGVSLLILFVRQFSSIILWLLIVGGLLAGFMGEGVTAGAIGAIVLLNALIGFFQEWKVERALAALKKLSSPFSKVMRDGSLRMVLSERLVEGDVVLLEAGDHIPADGRFVSVARLQTNESALTGESLPMHKESASIDEEELSIGERRNMGFMGTMVVSGKGQMVVCARGEETELGRIASLLTGQKEETPLQGRLRQLGHYLVIFCLGAVGVVFFLGWLRGMPFVDLVLTTMSLAVAAVPESLPTVVTVALTLGVQRMARKKALVKRLSSVETLGCASVIGVDKTGTLTQNEMAVERVWVDGDEESQVRLALSIGAICNSASIQQVGGKWEVTGDPTEGALLVAAKEAGIECHCPIIGEIPFDSERKMMSVLVPWEGGLRLMVKGAPAVILEKSVGGAREKILEETDRLAENGLRVLAVAFRDVAKGVEIDESLENELTIVGLIALRDPPRPEVKEAVSCARAAGIRAVMITGDHLKTAVAIAREIGLMQEGDRAVEGKELEGLSDGAFREVVRSTAVFARVSAEHKMRIVRAFKEEGAVVAVTGDGVNDAPAIQEGDIGVAMGMTGTEVTKESADMVILDDNFATIVHAVEEGRGIYDNILKFVSYGVSFNVAELLLLLMGMLLAWRDGAGHLIIPLGAMQLLWLNFVSDGLPSIALGLDPVSPDAMRRAPRPKSEPIISRRVGVQIGWMSLILALGALVACFFGVSRGLAHAQTMTLSALVLFEFVRVQMVRAQFGISFFANLWVFGALLFSFVLQLAIVYLPSLRVVFGTVPLGWGDWGVLALIALCVWLAGSCVNYFFKR